MTRQLTVNYPETFPDALGQSQEQFEQAAKWAMAVKLFELKQLSSGMAATLLGVDRTTFLPQCCKKAPAIIFDLAVR
ncbi:MAG: Uncharacterized protein family (UPF0175) [Phormidium sp. OSCR]|nr:MAG: Uncharacterized protein family (UPF0175) [Phormidium sp. OSCR]